jgi:tetraacyldisaccharide 4'-kinase
MKPPEAARGVEALWYGRSPVAWLLLPFAGLFAAGSGARRLAYRAGWFKSVRLPVPVLVVGNITVGGTGKTPVTAWLATLCRENGFRPGIVSRGYGGGPAREPRLVRPDDDAREVGDEPLLLSRQTGVPVCVHPDRVAAGRRLLAEGVNVVIADDGLQHYRLHRDLEIAVLDGQRRLGNGFLLPAGPLREPASRLAEVDLVLVNGGEAGPSEFAVQSTLRGLRSLDGRTHCGLDSLRGRRVRMVAGIGNPGRFQAELAAAGLLLERVPVPDHGRVDLARLCHDSSEPIVMTEKDAVKYAPVPGCPVWVALVDFRVPPAAAERVLECLGRFRG